MQRWLGATFMLALAAAAPASAQVPTDTTAAISVTIGGLPPGTDGNVTLNGPVGYTRRVAETEILRGLAAGRYVVIAAPVAGGGSTYIPSADSQEVTLVAGATANVTVTYAPPLLSGGLAVTIAGLPTGATANVLLTSLGGFRRALPTSQTFASIIPGAYAVTGAYVTYQGTTYAPAPATQLVNVVAGGAISATVTYSVAAPAAFAPLAPGFQTRTIEFHGEQRAYQVFVPRAYTPAHAWPIILFAHGSGERGTENSRQMRVGLGPYVEAHAETFPAIVVFPQWGNGQLFTAFDTMMIAILDATMREANVDSTRQYLTGVSAGGAREWWLAYTFPDRFAALAPMSSPITPKEYGVLTQPEVIRIVVPALKSFPIRQYNGDKDTQVPIATYGYPVRNAFVAAGATHYTFIEVPNGTHGSTWDTAYADSNLWNWLFAQRRAAPAGTVPADSVSH